MRVLKNNGSMNPGGNLEDKYLLVYKTSTTPVFPICLIAAAFSGRFEELTDERFPLHKVILIINDGAVSFFFDKDLSSIAHALFKDTGLLLRTLKEKETRVAKDLLKQIDVEIDGFFSSGNLNAKGRDALHTLFRTITSYGCITDGPGFLFQMHLEGEFVEDIENLGLPEEQTNEIIHYAFSSSRLTNYERFIHAIGDAIKKRKTPKEVADEYYWVVHDYLGDIVDKEYVVEKIEEFRREGDLEEHILAAKKRIEKIHDVISLLPANMKGRIRDIQEILYIYNERKKQVLSRVNIFIRKVVAHKFSEHNLKSIYQLSPNEIISLLQGDEIQYEERNRRWNYELLDRDIRTGADGNFSLVQHSRDLALLRGQPASKGSVQGIARIILNVSHMHKFQKGDILIAPFTNVNYLPIMRKAKAILTETGGTTSHAAVVSRELGIPCIVSIKDLLLALQDGDEIEVDAETGIVRRIA